MKKELSIDTKPRIFQPVLMKIMYSVHYVFHLEMQNIHIHCLRLPTSINNNKFPHLTFCSIMFGVKESACFFCCCLFVLFLFFWFVFVFFAFNNLGQSLWKTDRCCYITMGRLWVFFFPINGIHSTDNVNMYWSNSSGSFFQPLLLTWLKIWGKPDIIGSSSAAETVKLWRLFWLVPSLFIGFSSTQTYHTYTPHISPVLHKIWSGYKYISHRL